MVSPGTALVPPSLLARVRPGVVISGVVSLPLAVVAPLATVALFEICAVPAATVFATVTTNVAEPLAPAARLPIVSVHGVPAALPSAQLHPPVLPALVKVVLAGTVSLNTTPARPMLPVLA